MLGRLSKLAAVSASIRRMVEKRAGLVTGTLKTVGKTVLNNPGKTALGVGAGIAGMADYKQNKKGFSAVGRPTPTGVPQ